MSVDLNPTADQTLILDAARAMLETHYPIDRLLRPEHQGDPMQPLSEFGAFSLALPEEAGGADFSLIEEALLHVALGRHMIDPAALASAVAVRITQGNGLTKEPKSIAEGTVSVTAGVSTDDGILLLTGDKPELAVLSKQDSLTLVDVSLCNVRSAEGMGASQVLYQVDHSAKPTVLARAENRVSDIWQLLIAAQLLGIAEQTLEVTVDYVQTREQFGRPIGGFQAIKHRCADMAIRCESLSALLDLTAITLNEQHDEAAFNLAALVTLAPGIALDNARASIQLHGALGFSSEAVPHLFLKQAHLLATLLLPVEMCTASAPLTPLRESTT